MSRGRRWKQGEENQNKGEGTGTDKEVNHCKVEILFYLKVGNRVGNGSLETKKGAGNIT